MKSMEPSGESMMDIGRHILDEAYLGSGDSSIGESQFGTR